MAHYIVNCMCWKKHFSSYAATHVCWSIFSCARNFINCLWAKSGFLYWQKHVFKTRWLISHFAMSSKNNLYTSKYQQVVKKWACEVCYYTECIVFVLKFQRDILWIMCIVGVSFFFTFILHENKKLIFTNVLPCQIMSMIWRTHCTYMYVHIINNLFSILWTSHTHCFHLFIWFCFICFVNLHVLLYHLIAYKMCFVYPSKIASIFPHLVVSN